MNKAARWLHTLRHLRFRQLFYQLYYRVFGVLQSSKVFKLQQGEKPVESRTLAVKVNPTHAPLWGRGMQERLQDNRIAPTTYLGNGHFNFLNQNHNFGSIEKIDWNHNPYGKLWTYNLNYFEFLRQPELDQREALELIDDWIDKSANHRDAWEPYPISLRLVHWLMYLGGQNEPISAKITTSLYQQYRTLWTKVEYHLGGNHLLENEIALVMAGQFFGDKKRLPKAEKLLLAELKEQYTTDGAHYELSPMYHCILLWRLLDLYRWSLDTIKLDGSTDLLADTKPPCYLEVLEKSLTLQLRWLALMIDENGSYPHFNDSTAGIAPLAQEVLQYGRNLKVPFGNQELSTSGYRHWQTEEADIWLDVAAIGPDYIPGHAHADNLNFTLSLHGAPIIVDTGISTYEKNATRRRERGTAAHNTVTIDAQNSSDVWGGFRVGKRAETKIVQESANEITAEHNGYRSLGFRHRRSFELLKNTLTIQDQIIGSKSVNAVSYVHFNVGQRLEIKGNRVIFSGGEITVSPTTDIAVENYECALGFNRTAPASRLRMTFKNESIAKISW